MTDPVADLPHSNHIVNPRSTVMAAVDPGETADFDLSHVDLESDSPDLMVTIEDAQGHKTTAQIVQIATNEVRVYVPNSLKPGAIVLFAICDQAGQSIWQSPAEAHWVHKTANHVEAGLFFHQRVSEELIAWTRWDRRSQLRYPVRIASRIWWDSQAESVPVMLVNYSSNGIGILTPQPGHVGRNFLLSTCEPGEEMVVVQGNCCWQVSHDRGFMIGCELPPNQGRRLAGRVVVDDEAFGQ